MPKIFLLVNIITGWSILKSLKIKAANYNKFFISDEVRAPIPQKQEVLIQPGFEGYSINRSSNMLRANRVRSVFDGFRNFSNEASKFYNYSFSFIVFQARRSLADEQM